jgi:hypothetical protein
MGIRFYCPNGHKLNVKEFQAGRRGICPFCGARTQIPTQSTRPTSKSRRRTAGQAAPQSVAHVDDEEAQGSDSSPDILPGEPPALPGDPGYALAGGGKMLGPSTAPGSQPPGAVVAPPTADDGKRETASAKPATGQQSTPMPTSTAAPGPAAAGPSPGRSADFSAPPLPPQAAKEPPDPIAEAPEMIWYIRPPSGGQFGPASGDLMRTWLSEGRISADSLVWREGWHDWQEAAAVFPKLRGSQFVDLLEPAPAVSVPAAAVIHAHRPKGHRSSDRSQLALLAVLSLAVVVLVFVFLYVLMKP